MAERGCRLRDRLGGRALIVDLTASPVGVGREIAGVVLALADRTIGLELEDLLGQRARSELFAQLATGIAHELRNPLGGIRGAAELLLGKLSEPALSRYAELIRGETERMRRLLDDLAELTRGGDLRLRRENLHRTIDDLVELHSRSGSWRGIRVVREYDPSIPEFEFDPDRTTQVLLNLVRNAVQAMAGKGTLTLRTRIESGYHLEHVGPDRSRMVRDRRRGHRTRDSRRGPAAALHAVLHPPRRGHGPGPGGRAALDRAPGRPHPGHEPRRHGDTHACRAAALEAGMTRILVADDEASIRFVLREALSEAGHEVVEAADGNEARERLGSQRFDLALLDIRMPGPSGLELLDELSARGNDGPLVVILTAQNTFENAVEAMKRGAFDYLTKPFDLPQVRGAGREGAHRCAACAARSPSCAARSATRSAPARRWSARRPRCSTCSRRSGGSPRATRRC